jgi:hypothetical protein
MPKCAFSLPALLLVFAAATVAQSNGNSPDRAFIAHARKMYYSLQQEGVRELWCQARPGWSKVLTSVPSPSPDAKKQALAHLSTTEFKVVITESDTEVTVEQSADHSSGEVSTDLAAIIDFVRADIQQTFDLWRMVTFKPLLPGPKLAYRLEHRAGKYDLFDGGGQQLELDEKGLIQTISASIPGAPANLSIPLRYDESTHGLVLSSLGLRTVAEASPLLEMTLQYLEQDGLQLPSAIICKTQHPFGVVSTEVKINRYEIVRR